MKAGDIKKFVYAYNFITNFSLENLAIKNFYDLVAHYNNYLQLDLSR